MAIAPVFILPGLLEDADAFKAQVEALRARVPCSIADLTRSDTIAGLAQEALKEAPAGKFCLAGHSMGGYVALEIMRQAPERVARLALLNTHARPDTPEATENRKRLMELAEKDFAAVIQALMPKLMIEEHVRIDTMTGVISEMALGTGKEAFLRQQRAIIGRIDSRPHLAAIKCPTLVVAARGDLLMPVEILQELADGIPGAKLAIVENSGHMASIEQPEAVTKLLMEWVEG
jgi:pimeloyl-ACP methyl ester carboxylesterase